MGIPNEQAQDLGMRTDLSELEDNIHSYLPPSPPQDFGMQAFAPIIRDDDLNIQQVQTRVEIAKPPPEAMRGAPELIRESKEESHIQGNIDPISNDQTVGAAGFLQAIVAFVKRILYLLRD
jgi:hypothetical protein